MHTCIIILYLISLWHESICHKKLGAGTFYTFSYGLQITNVMQYLLGHISVCTHSLLMIELVNLDYEGHRSIFSFQDLVPETHHSVTLKQYLYKGLVIINAWDWDGRSLNEA